MGVAGVAVWVAADLLSSAGRESASIPLGAIASGLLAVWIFLARRRATAARFLPSLLRGTGLWAIPGLVLMAAILALQTPSASSAGATEGPPPLASWLVSYVLILGPFWVWLVLVGGYLMHYPGTKASSE